MVAPLPDPPVLSSSPSLADKTARFSAWAQLAGLLEGDDEERVDDQDATRRSPSRLHTPERKHRDCSRQFAIAAASSLSVEKAPLVVTVPLNDTAPPATYAEPIPKVDEPMAREVIVVVDDDDDGRRPPLFTNFAFFYMPDVAIGPRRLRISKASQHGARRVHAVAAATHVIVDKRLTWADVAPFVGHLDTGGDGGRGRCGRPWLVNEAYPLDCISFGCVLDPSQWQYRVRGAEGVAEAECEEHRPGPDAAGQQSRRHGTGTDKGRLRAPRNRRGRTSTHEHALFMRQEEQRQATACVPRRLSTRMAEHNAAESV